MLFANRAAKAIRGLLMPWEPATQRLAEAGQPSPSPQAQPEAPPPPLGALPLFEVRTFHGTGICRDPVSGTLVHAPASAGYPPALLYAGGGGIGFLIVASAESGITPTIAPVRIRAGVTPGTCTLIQPANALLLCALPATGGAVAGTLSPVRETADIWETFTLLPLEAAPSAPMASVARSLWEVTQAAPTLAAALARLAVAQEPGQINVLRATVAAFACGDAQRAALYMDNPAAMAQLSDETDPWLLHGIPDMKRWLEDRDRGERRRVAGPDFDFLAELPAGREPAGRAIAASIRRTIEPRYRACVIATARNEGVYLLEWIAYHRALGFEHFFIYTNDNDDGSDPLLAALADAGIITWIDNILQAAVPPQAKAYAHALGLLPDVLDYDWALVIDIDEFLVLDPARFSTIYDYLGWQMLQPVDAITLNWLMYGTYGMRRYVPDQLLTRRFLTRQDGANPHIKSLCRPRYFIHSHPHYPRPIPGFAPVFRDSNANPYRHQEEFAFSVTPLDEAAWINHYWSKSIDELLCKFSRNRGDMANVGARPVTQIIDDIASRVLHVERVVKTVQDQRIEACSLDLRGGIAQLRDLPGVRAAADATERVFIEKIKALREAVLAIDPAALTPQTQAVVDLVRDTTASIDMSSIGAAARA